MNEPTTSTELLSKDIEYTSSIDPMMITGVVPDKMTDVIVDFKLTILYLSASSLAMSFALPTAILNFVLVVVLLSTRKRKAKESESANTELTRMREFMTETVKSKQASKHLYFSDSQSLKNVIKYNLNNSLAALFNCFVYLATKSLNLLIFRSYL
jgi:hypothetical protein